MERIINIRKNLMSPTYALFQTFKDPVVISRASMQYCYGPQGEKYLDLLASNLTISVGHAHPRCVEAAKKQVELLPHLSSMYYSEPASNLTERLLSKFKPRSDGEKWQVLYAVTGTEAVEIALQLARVASGNMDIMSLANSYHGSYGTAMGCSGISACKHSLPETGGIHHLASPIYEQATRVDEAVAEAELTINASTPGAVAGFLFEALQGYGGIHVLPFDYVRKMAKLTQDYGGYVIADEIQTGLGRMGSDYWSFEMSGVEPDIITIAKGLGNGFPISAVVARESIFEKFADTGKFIFSTYGANPVAAAVADEVLQIVDDEKVQDRAAALGKIVSARLHKLEADFELCTHVRGSGLMWGIELDVSVARQVFEAMKDQQYLVGLGGAKKNVLRFMPPMCLTADDINQFADTLTETMIKVSNKA